MPEGVNQSGFFFTPPNPRQYRRGDEQVRQSYRYDAESFPELPGEDQRGSATRHCSRAAKIWINRYRVRKPRERPPGNGKTQFCDGEKAGEYYAGCAEGDAAAKSFQNLPVSQRQRD